MKPYAQISETVNTWIAEEELPVRANLKVVKQSDPDYGLPEDEIQDRNEFIRCYLLSEFQSLTLIPKQDTEDDFFVPDCTVDEAEYSAFNTVDFQRTQRLINKYWYAMKIIMERVKDMAIMHSSISQEEGRKNLYRRYEALVEREFRNRLMSYAERFKTEEDDDKRVRLKQKIAELNRRILDCKRIWGRYAPPENWDR
jgi:hypothetical protein